MLEYTLVICDIDGTLVDAEKKISPFNKKMIKEFCRCGGRISFATGRIEKSAIPYYEELEMHIPIILYNGARIYHPDTKTAIYDSFLTTCDVDRAIDLLPQFPFDYVFYSNGEAYTLKRSDNVRRYEEGDRITCALIDSVDVIKEREITKILMIGDNSSFKEFRDLFSDDAATSARLVQSELTFLEILPSAVSKGSSLLHLADYLGIDMKRIACFGDGLNDMEMIRNAGLGVAMGNARQELKDAADIVAPSNTEDGVGKILAAIMEKKI
ncbi:Cof-type HAD-IIB family hydrolase [Sediminispirochaeta smaragdinae]|uniref:Cof-like hydrolase n=1 Tax=Sediminispirochaeta smaragdinae (strain DSM 11293 / JCM 15392 / SEBR 4228) TaxID=573413 RepID=E1R6F6_SEDSS|nr:Cof-type HAD-IIB family hydrolase [Sediminispirochaeta smaragdinae]ADK80974.1 Cof-like hydrolase [Sediminispirochaeta smaragdinae DSM 11293]